MQASSGKGETRRTPERLANRRSFHFALSWAIGGLTLGRLPGMLARNYKYRNSRCSRFSYSTDVGDGGSGADF